MASPLQGGIAKTIGKALAGVMYPVTLSRTTEGYYDPDTGTVVPGETLTFPAKGMIEDYNSQLLDKGISVIEGGVIQRGDRKATILATTLGTTPQAGDKLTADGTTYTVLTVSSDPAKATWGLQVR